MRPANYEWYLFHLELFLRNANGSEVFQILEGNVDIERRAQCDLLSPHRDDLGVLVFSDAIKGRPLLFGKNAYLLLLLKLIYYILVFDYLKGLFLVGIELFILVVLAFIAVRMVRWDCIRILFETLFRF